MRETISRINISTGLSIVLLDWCWPDELLIKVSVLFYFVYLFSQHPRANLKM